MKQQLTDNLWRREKFQVNTFLQEQNECKLIYKEAVNNKAVRFLEGLVAKEKKACDYLQGSFDILCGKLADHRMVYDYLPYPSLEEKIAESMRQGRLEESHGWVREYVRKIYLLPRCRTLPQKFLETFDCDGADGIGENDCLMYGVLDILPRNIFVDENNWIVIDNEWLFDFPVPVIYVLFRAVRTLSITFQSEIRAAAAFDNRVVGMFRLGFKTFYVPARWVKYLEDPKITLQRMLNWEKGLKRYIAGPKRDSVGKINRRLKEKTRVPRYRLF